MIIISVDNISNHNNTNHFSHKSQSYEHKTMTKESDGIQCHCLGQAQNSGCVKPIYVITDLFDI